MMGGRAFGEGSRMATHVARSRRIVSACPPCRHDQPATAPSGVPAGEVVPVTVWPLPAELNSRPPDVGAGERPSVDAVIQRVLACYPVPGTRVVVDGA